MIPKTKEGGNVIADNEEIPNAFHQVYFSSHNQQKTPRDKREEYMARKDLLKISEEQRRSINVPIIVREICDVAAKKKRNQAPQLKKEMDKLENIQRREATMIKDLVFLSQAKMSREQTSEDHLVAKLEKAQVVSRLVKQAPPGEFSEVFSDLRMLVDDDAMMCEEAENLCAMHNKDHFTPVQTEKCNVLLTRHNELEENRFLDPQSGVSFKYDHLRRTPSDFQAHHEEDKKGEAWRRALHEALKAYVCNHYPEGLCSVFIKDTAVRTIFVACIESYRHRPSAFWNGLWRSEWTFALVPASTSTEVTGSVLVQAHYFEDANTHLNVVKDVEETLLVTDKIQTAQEFVKLVEKVENAVQRGLMEEYQHLNGTYLKSFRRQLPITHTRLDWEKVVTVRVVEARTIQV